MRFILVVLALFVVSSALECYVGRISNGKNELPLTVPKLTQCTEGTRCCVYGTNYFAGTIYGCGKMCPLKLTTETKAPNSDGFRVFCPKAEGKCKPEK